MKSYPTAAANHDGLLRRSQMWPVCMWPVSCFMLNANIGSEGPLIKGPGAGAGLRALGFRLLKAKRPFVLCSLGLWALLVWLSLSIY